jgi:tetratricopeptide (TPR) repeat protein
MTPDHAWAHVALGCLKIYTNRAAQGVAHCERALALDPNLAEAHAMIGSAKFVIGRFEETETHIQEAMRLSPRDKHFSAWLVIAGVAQLYLGRDEKAVTCFRRSVETNRNHPAAQYYLAGALALLGRLEEAQSAVRAAMALHPDFTISRFRSGAASDNPRYLAARERLCEGMRKAGVPEESAPRPTWPVQPAGEPRRLRDARLISRRPAWCRAVVGEPGASPPSGSAAGVRGRSG